MSLLELPRPGVNTFIDFSPGKSSGGGADGITSWWWMPSWSVWNDADMEKIVSPCWIALTRRVQNEPPSRSRSMMKTVGAVASPGRMKYPCSECTRKCGSTVRTADTSDWPAT
jgi:hypothetical protein